MYKTFAIINIVLASHSFLAAFLLFVKKSNQEANRYLGIINLVMGVLFLTAYLSLDRFYSQPALLVYLIIPLVFFITPLCYLYTFRLARTETKNDGYHFIPACIAVIYVMLRWNTGLRQPRIFIEEIFSLHYIPFDLYLLLQIGLLMLAMYLLKMLMIVRTYNKGIKHVYSSIEKTNLQWLQIHLGFGVCGSFIFFLTNIMQFLLPPELNPILNRVEYAGQAFSIVFLLSIVYFTFIQADIGEETREEREIKKRGSSPAYARQRLGEEKEREYADLLLACMKERQPFLDPELTVQDLAEILDISAAHLTMVLNICLKKNFYQFINYYRVQYAGKLLTDTRMENENILTVALESGFNSKSSFNTYFKKIQHMTPREYRQRSAGRTMEK